MPVRPFRTSTTFLAAMLAALMQGKAAAQTQVPAIAPPALFHFDISAGPLADTLTAFERVTGSDVQAVSTIHQLTSKGVRGTFTAADALSQLIEGTGLAARTTAPGDL